MKTIIVCMFLVSMHCFGQTQSELNATATAAYQQSDKQLNEVYQNIQEAYRANLTFLQNLKASQRIWIQLRDAQLKLKFPNREAGFYGSAHEMCRSIYLKELTELRLKELQEWLNQPEEGDVCTSSLGQYKDPAH